MVVGSVAVSTLAAQHAMQSGCTLINTETFSAVPVSHVAEGVGGGGRGGGGGGYAAKRIPLTTNNLPKVVAFLDAVSFLEVSNTLHSRA